MDARSRWGVGNATHLGLHHGEGTVQTDSAEFNAPTDGSLPYFSGEFGSGEAGFTFTAANGDELACQYGRTDKGASKPGEFVLVVLNATGGAFLVEAYWIAEFVPQPEKSTGRFKGVTGSWIMYAQSEPFFLGSNDPVSFSWEGEGRLTFPKGKP